MEQNKEEKKEYVSLPYYGIPRIIPYVKPYLKTLLVMAFLGAMSSLIECAFPLFNRYALDHFVAENTLDTIVPFSLFYLLLIGLIILSDYICMFWACKIEIRVGQDLKNKAFEHLQTLSFSYFNQNDVGYVHARIMSDTSTIGGLISWRFMDIVWNMTYLIFTVVMMLIVDARLSVYLLILIPITAIIIYAFQKKLVKLHRKIREINSRITGHFNEGITGAGTIKTLAVEKKMEGEFVEETQSMRRISVSASRYSSFFLSTVVLMGSVALGLVLWKGGALTMEGVIRLGTLSVFFTYAMSIMDPVQFLVETISQLIQVQVNIERLTKLLQTESDVADSQEIIAKYGDTFEPKKENWEDLHGDIEFKNVFFKYPDGDEYVLEDFNLKVPHGTNIAIVGETGAGKSTLVNLVCRFFEPTKGTVLIDGRDARQRSQLWLHSNLGYVLQTPHLFSGSVRDNLRYGNPDATEDEIWEALKLVSADDIVREMDGGLDAEVGEGGSQLSTGQKQLLSFARAILANPKILVLDEATSSIDTMTEKAIQDAISTVIKGRTSFVIAHRLSTIVGADVILVVQDGKIIERGTHKELIKKRGYYYELYSRQYDEMAVDVALG